MWTKFSRYHVSFRRHHLVTTGLLLIALCLPAIANAQQPTATIGSVNGTALVSIQGNAPVAAAVGMVLQAGDIIETRTGAQAVLTLSDGSELRLRPNTKIDIAELTQRPKSKARKSRIKLLYGKLRAVISPDHQEEGSSFEIETPNALAGVKFSRPIIEASYDPATATSVFNAFTVVLTITHRSTGEVRQIPQGSQAIIHEESLSIIPIPSALMPTSPEESQEIPPTLQEIPQTDQQAGSPSEEMPRSTPQTAIRSQIIRQAHNTARGATSSTVPISVGAVGTGETETTGDTGGTTSTETSTNPSPGTPPERPEQRTLPRPVTLTIHEE